MMVTLGVDSIGEYEHWLKNARVGLLTNITGRDSKNRSTIDVLSKICRLTALFGPEHGVRGDMGAGIFHRKCWIPLMCWCMIFRILACASLLISLLCTMPCRTAQKQESP